MYVYVRRFSYKQSRKEVSHPKTFSARFPNRAREMAYFGTSCFVVGVKSERVWEHLNGGWIPVFSLVQSPRYGTNMAGAIIYAPHLFTCVIFVRAVHVRVYAPRGKTGRCCALHLSKCRSVSDATFIWENDTFVHIEIVYKKNLSNWLSDIISKIDK